MLFIIRHVSSKYARSITMERVAEERGDVGQFAFALVYVSLILVMHCAIYLHYPSLRYSKLLQR